MRTRWMTRMALYTSIALVVFVIEAQIPLPMFAPGVKLGLANVVTLIVISLHGRRAAATVLGMRVGLGALLSGRLSVVLFSGFGGFLAFVVMALGIRWMTRGRVWVVSVFAALAHNVGQLLMAGIYLRSPLVVYYAPILMIAAILTGAFVGVVAEYLLRHGHWMEEK